MYRTCADKHNRQDGKSAKADRDTCTNTQERQQAGQRVSPGTFRNPGTENREQRNSEHGNAEISGIQPAVYEMFLQKHVYNITSGRKQTGNDHAKSYGDVLAKLRDTAGKMPFQFSSHKCGCNVIADGSPLSFGFCQAEGYQGTEEPLDDCERISNPISQYNGYESGETGNGIHNLIAAIHARTYL